MSRRVHRLKRIGVRKTAAAAVVCLAASIPNEAWALDDRALAPLPRESGPYNAQQIALGKILFFDGRISGDASTSCATCHVPESGFAGAESDFGGPQPLSAGYPGSLYFRNTPTLINASLATTFFWDGRLSGSDLPTLVRDHISEAHFMNADGRLVIERMRQIPEYEEGFRRAFGGEPGYGSILGALAAFTSSLRSRNAPIDRFLRGDRSALSGEARHGYELFLGKANCSQCHAGALLTDGGFHRLGVPENPEIFTVPERHITFRRFLRTLGVSTFETLRADPGRSAITLLASDHGKFRTPTLREVARTAPYMHNGMLASLEEVIDFYDGGGGEGSELQTLGLSAAEKAALVELLQAFSGDAIESEEPASPPYAARQLGKN